LSIIFLATPAFGETWYNANQATVAWSPVTTLADGQALPAGSTIQYRVYIQDSILAEPVEVTSAAIPATSFVITFSNEGSYYVGARAERVAGGSVVSSSVIAWSSDPANCQGNEAFGVRQYAAPASVGGLRKE